MFLQKTLYACLFIILYSFSAAGQEKALSKIDIRDLKEHLKFIASDDLQGRKLGTPVDGLEITANYLAEYAKGIGLKPGSQDYFQEVAMSKFLPGEFEVQVKDKKGKVRFESDESVLLNSNTGMFTCTNENVVLIGFGQEILESDVKGKVVVVAQGNRETFKKGVANRWDFQKEGIKMAQLLKMEPKVILFISDPRDKDNKVLKQVQERFNRERYSLKEDKATNEAPVLVCNPDFADALMGSRGDYNKYLLEEVEKNTITPVEIADKKFSCELRPHIETVSSKNVVGFIEGSDPELKNEYVVFLAHYDHLGIGKDGDVYNGADDNGSGTVAIMEVAEAFASLEVKPKRSIVFLWVTCEEIGHFGSRYYCDHPVFPLENTVAAINLDMVGRVYDGPRDDVWKDSPKKVKDFDGLYTLSNDVWPELAKINDKKCRELNLVPDTSLPPMFLRASDHYHFHRNGVPILNYATGYHADYHKVGDEVGKINFKKIKRVAELCFLVGYEVGNLENIYTERK